MTLRPSISDRRPKSHRLARWAKRGALAAGTLAIAAAMIRAWLGVIVGDSLARLFGAGVPG